MERLNWRELPLNGEIGGAETIGNLWTLLRLSRFWAISPLQSWGCQLEKMKTDSGLRGSGSGLKERQLLGLPSADHQGEGETGIQSRSHKSGGSIFLKLFQNPEHGRWEWKGEGLKLNEFKELQPLGISLAVQWLRPHTSTAGNTDLIPGWGTKILRAVQCGQKIGKKKNNNLWNSAARFRGCNRKRQSVLIKEAWAWAPVLLVATTVWSHAAPSTSLSLHTDHTSLSDTHNTGASRVQKS